MAPFRPEEVTLPLRFICKTIHLVAVLTIIFDVDVVVSNVKMINPVTTSNRQELKEWDKAKQEIQGLTYAALVCFGIEYITLFLGVSMFFHRIMFLNILSHFVGMILVILWYTNNWAIEALVAFFVVFNALPAMLELLTFLFATRFSFLKY